MREILMCWFLLKKFVATSNRLLFYNLLILFVRDETDHHYQRSTFEKTLFSCIFGSKPEVFNLI